MPALGMLISGFVFLLLSSMGAGYPGGAPTSTCWTRYPKHRGIGTQKTPCPIHITFSSQTYHPEEEITVTVQDPSSQKRRFNGIEVGAFRDTGNQEEIVGQFVRYPTDKLKAQTCFGGYKNMVTHKIRMRVQQLQIIWKAPSQNVGNVTFRATIVANFETFWTGVEAQLPSAVQDAALISAPKYPPVISRRLVQDVDITSCGDTKGCFLYPGHCSGDECLAAVSFQYRPATNDYLFEIFATVAQNWIALGFSDDRIMGHDETVSCVSNAGLISVQHGWNPQYSNERLLNRFVSEAEVKHSDGHLQCRFVLPAESSIYVINQDSSELNHSTKPYSRDEHWHLMLAWGKAMPASDVLSKHTVMPVVTLGKVNLKDASFYAGSAFPVLVRVHAAIMMIAWIFFGGIVTVVSRHYRDWFPRVRWFGTKVWFQVHRGLAILIVIFTVIGLIVVFSHYGSSIRKYAIPHAYVGLTVVAAVCLQAIAGFLRPAPDHKMRFLFNWGHRFLGQSAHILAAVTMFLAYNIEYFNNNMRVFGIAVLSVWVAVQLLCHIGFEILTCKGMPLSPSQLKAESAKERTNDKCSILTVLFIVYVLVLAGLCTAALLAFLLF